MSFLNRLRNRRAQERTSGASGAGPGAGPAAGPAARHPRGILKSRADAPDALRDRLQNNYDETARCVEGCWAANQKHKTAAEKEYRRLESLPIVDPFRS